MSGLSIEYVREHYIETNVEHALASMPDRIRIRRKRTTSLDGRGIPSRVDAFVEWNGSTIIPCRFDNSRAFRPDALRAQEVVANEHLLHLPNGVDVRPDDQIILLTPVPLADNAEFTEGLSGWSGATSGPTRQEVALGGIRLTHADTITALLQQTVGAGYADALFLIEVWAEISEGEVEITTPAGVITLTAPDNDKFSIVGVHEDDEDDVFITASIAPASLVVTRFNVWTYTDKRIFEARKIASASTLDITMELLVSEMEFQHTND